jgi:hypothetical protein
VSRLRVPVDCPVCGGELVNTRLGCRNCGTELVGEFGHCVFCSLDSAETELLKVFLASRGNLKEVEKHLGVSYPTARARFMQLLVKLNLAGVADQNQVMTQEQILAEVSSGALTPGEAAALLAGLGETAEAETN